MPLTSNYPHHERLLIDLQYLSECRTKKIRVAFSLADYALRSHEKCRIYFLMAIGATTMSFEENQRKTTTARTLASLSLKKLNDIGMLTKLFPFFTSFFTHTFLSARRVFLMNYRLLCFNLLFV